MFDHFFASMQCCKMIASTVDTLGRGILKITLLRSVLRFATSKP